MRLRSSILISQSLAVNRFFMVIRQTMNFSCLFTPQ
jgi:hypothetical protein